MAITVNTKHDTHPVRIHLTREGKHYAALRCIPCNIHVQWLSRQDANELAAMGTEVWNRLTAEELEQERNYGNDQTNTIN